MLQCDSNFTENCSQESKYKLASIGSDNGLVPNRRQAIIWTNEGLTYCCVSASLCLNEIYAKNFDTAYIFCFSTFDLYHMYMLSKSL